MEMAGWPPDADTFRKRPMSSRAALKLRKRWPPWPPRLVLGVGAAATSQPPRHGSRIEVGGLAAHGLT